MEKQQEQKIDTPPTANNWTTREELLLSYAVKRHGFTDWDTVAVEIQSRSCLPQIFTSPHHCKFKYLELKRRFLQIENNNDNNDVDVDAEADDDVVPWLEDLRNLHVEELRREVHRYDDSILSLQRKVKRLEEERERSVEMNGNNDEQKPDLHKVNDENGSKNYKNEREREGEGAVVVGVSNDVPEFVTGELNAGEESDQEMLQSVIESNCTGLKDENQQTGLNDSTNKVQEVDRFVSKEPDSVVIKVVKPGGDNSCDEISDGVAKRLGLTPEEEQNKSEVNNICNSNNSTGSRNSESESERLNTERNDVQSSGSLTVKSRRNNGGAVEEYERGRSFGAMNQISVKSQPLAKIVDLIRTHNRGSLFERRLDSQASDKYKNVVRQHMDLQKIQKRLDQGSYSSCTSKFYRDLLLLFNNAIVFFPKSSAEFVAATELQKLVVTEMSKQTQRSDYSPEPSLTPHSQAQSKPDPEKPESLLDSQKSSAPIIVCRKRSSIFSKSASDSNKKRGIENEEKKTSIEVKLTSGNTNTHAAQEQQSLLNTDTKDRIITGTRSFRRSNSSLKTSAAPLQKQNNTSSDSNKKESPKIEKNNKKEKEKEKEKKVLTSVKKRGAADFLKRIKGSSPLDKSKSSANDTKNTRQNSNTAKRVENNDGREDKIILRQKPATKEDISLSKRNAGGAVKKPVEPVPEKRKTESEPSSSKRPQKRNRR